MNVVDHDLPNYNQFRPVFASFHQFQTVFHSGFDFQLW